MSVKEKYDRASRFYDYLKTGDTRRWGPAQIEFFKQLHGKILVVGMGPGPEIVHFPPHLDITAVDLSRQMLLKSSPRVANYSGHIQRINMNVEQLGFRDETFDCALTVCTFCTVEHPVAGLKELARVLKPGGTLLMFEHVMSRIPVIGLILKGMTHISKRLSGTYLDRDTVGNLQKAGFVVDSEQNIYLDIVKAIRCHPK